MRYLYILISISNGELQGGRKGKNWGFLEITNYCFQNNKSEEKRQEGMGRKHFLNKTKNGKGRTPGHHKIVKPLSIYWTATLRPALIFI